MSSRLQSFQVKIFADGADKASILELARNPLIQGFTTNPFERLEGVLPMLAPFFRDGARCHSWLIGRCKARPVIVLYFRFSEHPQPQCFR